MVKVTKIGTIREELSRIASFEDRKDLIAPTMKASWNFIRIMVIGKLKMQTFDYGALVELLKTIPDGAGEAQFWADVDAMNLASAPEQEPKSEGVVVQLPSYQQTQDTSA